MRHVDTVVVGAGHAGLAMSRSLGDRGLDHVVLERGRLAERWRSERWDSLRLLSPKGPARIELDAERIRTVVWATGFRRDYTWLRIPVLDGSGELRHRRGVTPVTGLYAIGLRFQHRRRSGFIDGARDDAAYLADHIATTRSHERLAS